MAGVRSYLFPALKVILTALVVYYAGKQLVQGWDEVVKYEWHLNFWWLSLSIVGHILAFVIFAMAWCALMSGFGHKVSLAHSFKLSYVANLGRYLPGKIWTVFGMAYMARQIGIPEPVAIASWIIAVIYSLPTAFLISAAGVMLHPEITAATHGLLDPVWLYVIGALSLFGSIVLLAWPDKTLYLANQLLKLTKRQPIEFHISTPVAFRLFMLYMVAWIVFGVAFWCFLKGMTSALAIPVTLGIGSYVFAYQVGFVAIFAPGGIGIREIAITGFLYPLVGSAAAGFAVAARVWNIVAEIIAALIALPIRISSNRKS